MMDNVKHIIESLLFVSREPLSIERIKRIIESADLNEIRAALDALSAEYEARKGGFYLRQVAGGYQLCTRPEHSEWIRRMVQTHPPRLSKAALETLAIIAYKQPLIRSDIEHIRGVDCGGIIRTLMERKLVRVLGRKEIPGRPLLYATTRHFLEFFDLKDLKDLPTPKEIEQLSDEALAQKTGAQLPLAQTDGTAQSFSAGTGEYGEPISESGYSDSQTDDEWEAEAEIRLELSQIDEKLAVQTENLRETFASATDMEQSASDFDEASGD